MRLNIDLDKLKIFYYVAKAKKFTTASELLNTSQSALSRSIRILEDRLGIKLFYRNPRGLTLTPQGEKLALTVEKIMLDIESTIEKLHEEEKEPKGPLKVVASVGLINFYLLEYIPEFLRLYPDIRLTIIGSDSIPSLEFGEAHIILRPPVPINEAGNIIQVPILVNHVGLYASKNYLEKFGTPKDPRDLDNHRLIALGTHPEAEPFKAMNWPLVLGTKSGQVREPYLQINSPHGRFEMAKAGLGIIALSKEHPGLAESGLVQLLSHIPSPTVENYCIYSKELERSKKVAVFRDYFHNILSSNDNDHFRKATKI